MFKLIYAKIKPFNHMAVWFIHVMSQWEEMRSLEIFSNIVFYMASEASDGYARCFERAPKPDPGGREPIPRSSEAKKQNRKQPGNMARQTLRESLFTSSQISVRPGNSLIGTVGAAVILLFGVVLLTGISLDRSQEAMVRFLAEKGIAIISALEGGVRSGTRSQGGVRFQFLIEEVAARPDVRFIAVTMPDGTILAHSDPHRLGDILISSGNHEFTPEELASLHPTEVPAWAIVNMEGAPSFVVYKVFEPRIRRGRARQRAFPSGSEPYIFLGLDLTPLEAAQVHDRRRALIIGGSVLLAGLLALLGLHALERLRASRRGQRAAEALAEELAVTLPDGLVLLDARGRVAQVNNAALRLLGLKASEVPGVLTATPAEVFSREQADTEYNDESTGDSPKGQAPLCGEDFRETADEAGKKYPFIPNSRAQDVLPPPLAELVTRLLREAVLPDTEITLSCDGHTRYLSVRGGHVNDEERERVGSLIFLRDMTDVRRLEAEIRQREKLAAVGNLAAGVAHELRNPLSSIKGYATYFGGRFPEGSVDREAAEIMVREVDRLNRAIGDLIGLSRPSDVKIRPTDMERLLQDTLRLIEQDAAAGRVRTHLHVADAVRLLPVDPDRMRQVVLNLCLNAIQAMPDGGQLDLALAPDPISGKACLEVRDTGTGMAPEVLPHIFNPYYTTKSQGTGLGLPTVHKILEAHAGKITVTSEPGKGTVFRLHLPMTSPPAPQALRE